MSGRSARGARVGFRAGSGAAGVLAVVLVVGACSASEPTPAVSGPVGTVAAAEMQVQGTERPAASKASAESAASAGLASPEPTAAVSTTEVPLPVPSTTQSPAPTSTWVVFEEVEEPPLPEVFGTARVLQRVGDDMGAMYWYRESNERPGQPPKRFEHAGAVFDLCRIEDAYFGTYGWYPDEGGVPDEYRRDWFSHFAPGDCRGPELVLERPLLDVWPGRYFTFDDAGSKSPSLASPQAAAEWYAKAVGEYGENSIPAGMTLAGTIGEGGGLGPSLLRIRYSDAVDPVDEVRVLPGTVTLGADGALRGLVRNWSRTLWAYGTVVAAGDAEWAWPLSIQPGETAPFEIEAWRGSTDPELVDFSVTAEMSADMDLSRAWWGKWDWQYWEEESNSGDTDPDSERYAFMRLNPISHPFGDAVWVPTLTLDLAVYSAELTPEGAVAEVTELEFVEYGLLRSVADLGEKGPRVLSYYPRAEFWVSEVGFVVERDALSDSWSTWWIGMPHPRAS